MNEEDITGICMASSLPHDLQYVCHLAVNPSPSHKYHYVGVWILQESSEQWHYTVLFFIFKTHGE